MLSEMLPRMVHGCGPVWTSALLSKLATSIGEGSAPARPASVMCPVRQ
jgi:hypothetical protein